LIELAESAKKSVKEAVGKVKKVLKRKKSEPKEEEKP